MEIYEIQLITFFKKTVIVPTEPPQLPGRCPESEDKAWIPFHGHCYYIESSATKSWPKASLDCIRLGKYHNSLDARCNK